MNWVKNIFHKKEVPVNIPDVVDHYGYLSTAEKMGIWLSVDEVFTQLQMASGETNRETIIKFIEYIQVFVAEKKLKDRVWLIGPYEIQKKKQ